MGRAALSTAERDAFRASMREVATRRFAKHGEAGVTMRGLAEDLGCSPMTPYKYFRDRDEIFLMVRVAAMETFAEAQEQAAASQRDPVDRLRALGRAYVQFAKDHPDQYRIMFELERPRAQEREAIAKLDRRTWAPMRGTIDDAISRGLLHGDPDELTHMCWAAVHGLATLHLSGKLRLGRDLDSLIEPTMDLLVAGASKPSRKKAR